MVWNEPNVADYVNCTLGSKKTKKAVIYRSGYNCASQYSQRLRPGQKWTRGVPLPVYAYLPVAGISCHI